MQKSGAKQHAEVTPEAPLYSMVHLLSPSATRMQLHTMLAVAARMYEWRMLLKQVQILPFHGAVCIIAGDLTALKRCLQVAEDIDGKEHIMREYKGKVLLITNVASECGFTESNYKGLQQLYDKYHNRGLEVQPLQGPA